VWQILYHLLDKNKQEFTLLNKQEFTLFQLVASQNIKGKIWNKDLFLHISRKSINLAVTLAFSNSQKKSNKNEKHMPPQTMERGMLEYKISERVWKEGRYLTAQQVRQHSSLNSSAKNSHGSTSGMRLRRRRV